MPLFLDADTLEHRIGVGITRGPPVAVGDLLLLRGFHPLHDHLDRGDPRLQALQEREPDGRRVGHRLAQLAQACFDALPMLAFGVGDGPDDVCLS